MQVLAQELASVQGLVECCVREQAGMPPAPGQQTSAGAGGWVAGPPTLTHTHTHTHAHIPHNRHALAGTHTHQDY